MGKYREFTKEDEESQEYREWSSLFSVEFAKLMVANFDIFNTDPSVTNHNVEEYGNTLPLNKRLDLFVGYLKNQKYCYLKHYASPYYADSFNKDEHESIVGFAEFTISQIKEQLNNTDEAPQFEIPDVDLKNIKDRVRLLHELGVLESLQKKFPNSFQTSINALAVIVSKFMGADHRTVYPYVRCLIEDLNEDKHYPKYTPKVKAIMAQINSNESF